MYASGASIADMRATIQRKYPQLVPVDDADTTSDRGAMTLSAASEVFARLFEAVHEGVYIGTIPARTPTPFRLNPYLKLMFGLATDTPQEQVRPFDLERFVDLQARVGFVERLHRDGAVSDTSCACAAPIASRSGSRSRRGPRSSLTTGFASKR